MVTFLFGDENAAEKRVTAGENHPFVLASYLSYTAVPPS